MDLSRRKLLKTGLLSGLSGIALLRGKFFYAQEGLLLGHAPQPPLPPASMNLTPRDFDAVAFLKRSDFSSRVGEPFLFFSPEMGRVTLTLTQVSDLVLPGSADHSVPQTILAHNSEDTFSLLFSGPRNQLLKQNTYKISNSRLGSFALLIVPMGEDASVCLYQAIFNRELPVSSPQP
ncbi:MAG: hypothetical protein PHX83_10210 [Acidobacteriia bacterium]|nr:hypothetical protein [Terriglobia bacterium]